MEYLEEENKTSQPQTRIIDNRFAVVSVPDPSKDSGNLAVLFAADMQCGGEMYAVKAVDAESKLKHKVLLYESKVNEQLKSSPWVIRCVGFVNAYAGMPPLILGST